MVILHNVEAVSTGGDAYCWEHVPEVVYGDNIVILKWPKADPVREVSLYVPNFFYVDVDRHEIRTVSVVE